MKTTQTPTITLRDNNNTARAFFEFCEGDLAIHIVVDESGKQYDFGIESDELALLANMYKFHLEQFKSKIENGTDSHNN